MGYRILTDDDVEALLTMREAIEKLEQALLSGSRAGLVAPPRFMVSLEKGDLVFTAGAEVANDNVIGFRVYETFRVPTAKHEQLVVVFDSRTGELRGLILGRRLGAVRTAALDGIAIKYMAPRSPDCLGMLGSGYQAGFHFESALCVRTFRRALVYSTTPDHRAAFAAAMRERHGLEVEAVDSAAAVVREADVLLCTTSAVRPVFDVARLRSGMHITTVGPKLAGAHELPVDAAGRSDRIVTDSIAQVDAFPRPFFLLGTPHRDRMIELCDVVAGKQPGRASEDEITLFCSVGLSATEVIVADQATRNAAVRQASLD
ncbi:MAG: hypothetical protein A2V88_08525 [Elusimicrobia bacterium RBG_16_66_12]|nr:MAG: hypothetical protein A2V88_08525 [Elusimicrobia bacterium RBG_16_66_12]